MAKQSGTCSYPGCTKSKHARDWCTMHYTRNRNHGTPDGHGDNSRNRPIPEAQLAAKSAIERILESRLWDSALMA